MYDKNLKHRLLSLANLQFYVTHWRNPKGIIKNGHHMKLESKNSISTLGLKGSIYGVCLVFIEWFSNVRSILKVRSRTSKLLVKLEILSQWLSVSSGSRLPWASCTTFWTVSVVPWKSTTWDFTTYQMEKCTFWDLLEELKFNSKWRDYAKITPCLILEMLLF